MVRPRQVLLFGLVGLMCGVAAAPTRADPGPIASVPLPGHGSLSVDVAIARSGGPDAWGYVEFRNSSDGPIQIVAMTSPDARSVAWTTARQVVSITDLYSAGSMCSSDRSAEEAANRQSRAIRDLVVPAHGMLSLRSGTEHVTMSGLARPLSAGTYTELELYLGDLTTSWSGSMPIRLRVE